MKVRAVCLDAGGVLQVPDSDLVRQTIAPLGVEPSREEIRAAHYLALAEAEGHATSADFDVWLKHYAVALGVPDISVAEAAVRLKDDFKDGTAWSEVVPGAFEALKDLEQRRLRVVIISNTLVAGVVADSLAQAGLCQVGDGAGICVDAVLDSSELGFSKPDPRMFAAALRATNTTADETIHVGDSLAADVRGAASVGIHPVHFDPLSLCADDSHDHLTDLRHLPKLLEHH